MTVPSLEDLIAARTAVHGLAEHVFAPAARSGTGSVRLRMHEGALSTPPLPAGGSGGPSRLELRDGRVARSPGGPVVSFTGTLGDLAAALGVEFGLTDPPYTPASGCGPGHLVDVDPRAVELILAAWRVGDAALRRLDDSQAPVVWPEHLDVAITRDGVNYGVSPGDGFEPWPYAYAGPHEPRTGDFWNAPFGAARRLSDLTPGGGVAAGDVLAFFQAGQAAAHP
jgi:hypothetical protein